MILEEVADTLQANDFAIYKNFDTIMVKKKDCNIGVFFY